MACVFCLAAWCREQRKEWFHINPEEAENGTYQIWICPSCCRGVHRDLRKDYKCDGHTMMDFKAEVTSLVKMHQGRYWHSPSSSRRPWSTSERSVGMDCSD